jgi:hypothetical protein
MISEESGAPSKLEERQLNGAMYEKVTNASDTLIEQIA